MSAVNNQIITIPLLFVQSLSQKASSKKLAAFAEDIVACGKQNIPAFETAGCYEEFLVLLKARQSQFANKEIYPKVLTLFRACHGLPASPSLFSEDVKLIGKDGASSTVSKEILALHFEHFHRRLNSGFEEGKPLEGVHTLACRLLDESALSQESLDCFKAYVYQKKISIPNIQVLDELFAWAHVIDDETFMADMALFIPYYLASKEHENEFDPRYIEGGGREFALVYLSKREIPVVPDPESIVISSSDFCRLTMGSSSPALEFVVNAIDGLTLDNPPTPVLELIPKKFRKSIQTFHLPSLLPSLDDIRKMVKLFPNALWKIKLLEKLVELFPPDGVDPFRSILAGQLERWRGNFNEAIKYFEEAVRLDPKESFALGWLGNVYRQQGKLDEAQAPLEEAVRLNPKDNFARGGLGDVYRQQSKLDEAKEQLEKALRLNPKDSFARGWLGDVYRQQGKLDEAQAQLEEAVRLNPKDSFTREVLGDVYRQQGKLDKAQAQLEEAVRFNPKDNFARGLLGDVYRQQGKLDEAKEQLKEAVRLNPKDNFARGRLGDVYRKQGKLDEAQAQLEEAVRLNPKSTFIRGWLGDVYRQQGKLDEAKEQLEVAVRLDPKSTFIRGLLGDVYRKQGKLDKAQAQLEEAVRLNPTNQFAVNRLAELRLSQGQDLPEGPDPMDIDLERTNLKRKIEAISDTEYKSEGAPTKKARTNE